jgi:hypothetical protein
LGVGVGELFNCIDFIFVLQESGFLLLLDSYVLPKIEGGVKGGQFDSAVVGLGLQLAVEADVAPVLGWR